jgi:hypothetical protein
MQKSVGAEFECDFVDERAVCWAREPEEVGEALGTAMKGGCAVNPGCKLFA